MKLSDGKVARARIVMLEQGFCYLEDHPLDRSFLRVHGFIITVYPWEYFGIFSLIFFPESKDFSVPLFLQASSRTRGGTEGEGV